MGRHTVGSHRQACIWSIVVIGVATLFRAQVDSQFLSGCLRGRLGQQVRLVQTGEGSQMLGGDKARSSGSYAGWNSLLPGDTGQRP